MMPYLGLDTETTGLNPEKDQLMQLAMVLDNDPDVAVDDLPHFNAVLWHKRICGDPVALKMNADLISFIADHPPSPGFFRADHPYRRVRTPIFNIARDPESVMITRFTSVIGREA